MKKAYFTFMAIMIALSICINNGFIQIYADYIDSNYMEASELGNPGVDEKNKYPTILEDAETVYDGVGGGITIGYIFTPKVNGKYAFSVTTDSGLIQTVPVYVYIYDEDNNLIAKSNSSSTTQLVYCDLYANKNYYLTYVGNSGDVYAIGTAKVFRVGNLPNSNGEEIITTDELWQIDEEITLENIMEILPDTEKKVNLSIYGAKSVHKFIPTRSGEYELISIDNEHIIFGVRNEKFNFIKSGGTPFVIEMEAGKCYIITSYISSNADDTMGEYIIKVNRKIEIIKGDIDEDEKVNAEDALIILKHAAKIELIAEDKTDVADVNEDKKIDAQDALEVLKIAAKITE